MRLGNPKNHWFTRVTEVTAVRIAIGIVVIGLIVFLGKLAAPHLTQLEHWIASQGIWAPVIYIAVVIVLSILCCPLDILFVAGGLMFNLGYGFIYVILAIYIGQSINFFLGRTYFRYRVQRWIVRKPKMRAINLVIKKKGVSLLFWLRMAPVPASPTSYLMGTMPLKYWQFCVATLGLVPVAFASMYFGFVAVHAARTDSSHHAFNLHDAFILGSLVVAIGVVAYIGHTANCIIKEAQKTK